MLGSRGVRFTNSKVNEALLSAGNLANCVDSSVSLATKLSNRYFVIEWVGGRKRIHPIWANNKRDFTHIILQISVCEFRGGNLSCVERWKSRGCLKKNCSKDKSLSLSLTFFFSRFELVSAIVPLFRSSFSYRFRNVELSFSFYLKREINFFIRFRSNRKSAPVFTRNQLRFVISFEDKVHLEGKKIKLRDPMEIECITKRWKILDFWINSSRTQFCLVVIFFHN